MKKNNLLIKELSSAIADEDKISDSSLSFILNKMTKSDLKLFLFNLKTQLGNKCATVYTASKPDEEFKKAMQSKFEGKRISYKLDETLGAGLKVDFEDKVLEVNAKNVLNKIISKIKESL